ncbi:unnamed protein product [marine sediment metagenome]|uniref:Uncharacterized protein n=1 Tax=marine sediment metagenome TaxID=412755 RepID=X1BKK4_9ZZZZ
MPRKRKDKKYWEDEAKKARRSARTSREKSKAFKEGLKEGLDIARRQ